MTKRDSLVRDVARRSTAPMIMTEIIREVRKVEEIDETKLTQSEQKALTYLRKNNHSKLYRYGYNKSPDFVNEDEEEFEVKKVMDSNYNYLSFTDKQIENFEESNPYIIVVSDDNIEIIRFSNLETSGYKILGKKSEKSEGRSQKKDGRSFTIERKLTRTSGGVVLRIPSQTVEAYDLNKNDYAIAKIEVLDSKEAI